MATIAVTGAAEAAENWASKTLKPSSYLKIYPSYNVCMTNLVLGACISLAKKY